LTVITGKDLHLYLANVAINEVWGIEEQTTAYLTRFGITRALDFARRDERWVREKLTKPHVMIWQELRGMAVIPLDIGKSTTTSRSARPKPSRRRLQTAS
jgi:hypothetical protein